MNIGSVVFFSIIGGIFFAANGVAYRLGQSWGLHPMQIITPASLFASIVFFICSGNGLGGAPWPVILWGGVAGFLQYVLNHIIRLALARGPLAPLCCALMLYFAVVIAVSGLFLGETITLSSIAAVLLAVVAVVAATVHAPAQEKPELHQSSRLIYGLLLLGGLAINRCPGIIMKVLSTNQPELLSQYGSVFLAFFYLGIALPGSLELWGTNGWRLKKHTFWYAAAIMTAGSMGGMFFQNMLISAPSSIVFTLLNTSSILAISVVSVFFWQEKLDRAFWGMIVATLGATICVSTDPS